jgi:hypothetical protein
MHFAIYFLRKEVMELAGTGALWKKIKHAPRKKPPHRASSRGAQTLSPIEKTVGI